MQRHPSSGQRIGLVADRERRCRRTYDLYEEEDAVNGQQGLDPPCPGPPHLGALPSRSLDRHAFPHLSAVLYGLCGPSYPSRSSWNASSPNERPIKSLVEIVSASRNLVRRRRRTGHDIDRSTRVVLLLLVRRFPRHPLDFSPASAARRRPRSWHEPTPRKRFAQKIRSSGTPGPRQNGPTSRPVARGRTLPFQVARAWQKSPPKPRRSTTSTPYAWMILFITVPFKRPCASSSRHPLGLRFGILGPVLRERGWASSRRFSSRDLWTHKNGRYIAVQASDTRTWRQHGRPA